MERNQKLNEWKELRERHDAFLKILGLLVQHDERRGRHLKFSDRENHHMRKAFVVAEEGTRRIFIRALGDSIYSVVVHLETPHGSVTTSWVHEDGIALDRNEFADEPDHLVHGIVCLTDLFMECCRTFDNGDLPPDSVRRLMAW